MNNAMLQGFLAELGEIQKTADRFKLPDMATIRGKVGRDHAMMAVGAVGALGARSLYNDWKLGRQIRKQQGQ